MPADEDTEGYSDTPGHPPSPPLPPAVEGHEDSEGGDGEGDSPKIGKYTEKPKHWTTYLETICALALVIITGTYTYYARQQAGAAIIAANAASSAADTAKNTLLLTQRAYLATGDPVEILGGWAVIRVPINNDGNIAATNVTLRVNFERVRPNGEVLEDRVMDVPMPEEIPSGKSTASFVISMPHMDTGTMDDVSIGKQDLVVRGHLKYDSGFQRPRVEELVFDYQASQKRWVNSGGTSIDVWLDEAKERDIKNLPRK